MPIIIRTAFNNQEWCGHCQHADRDRRLFQCKNDVVKTGYKINKKGVCQATCWESTLCTEYWWKSAVGEFSERAEGKAYFVYRDTDSTLVLWGRSTITERDGSYLYFKKFKPLNEKKAIKGLTYKELESIGVPGWGAGTFRYISEETADLLDIIIKEGSYYFDDPAEPFSDIEGRRNLKKHLKLERSSRLVKEFKASLSSYKCEVCGFDFGEKYGHLGYGFIEAHHNKPLASLKKQTITTINDLSALCSNCHRMLHRSNPPISIKELAKLMKENS
ncbi:HNH endonuclease [Desulfonatronovibrio magnus]|uniref:HNH endonuclease n=1 Tax=Desulfonatronovibrio magnus TaxID=698827 RepID=UPI000698D817|nr:HNH endonuclease [Desulfonatronovibrio magnus]